MQGKCLNLKEQVDLFEKTVKSDLSGLFKNPNDLADYLSKSIFLVSVGSNDFINNYLQPTLYDTSKRYPPPQFAQLLMNVLSHQFEVYIYIYYRSDHHHSIIDLFSTFFHDHYIYHIVIICARAVNGSQFLQCAEVV